MNDRYKETICPECDKVFYPEYLMKWGWKNPKGELVCSYPCQRKSESNPKKINSKGKRISVRIVETGEIFKSITACANIFDVKAPTINYYINNGKPFRGLHIERVVK